MIITARRGWLLVNVAQASRGHVYVKCTDLHGSEEGVGALFVFTGLEKLLFPTEKSRSVVLVYSHDKLECHDVGPL